MIKILRNLLEQILDDIDSGNSNVSESEQQELITIIQKITSKELSKIESSNYIGVSRATFDNYIKKGLIPEGIKRQGVSNLFWRKSDLDIFLQKYKKVND